MGDEELKVRVIADTDQAERKLSGLGKVLSVVGGLAGGVFKVGLAAATAGLVALGGGFGFALKEAMAAQQVLAQTNAVIKSTGGIAGVSADELAGWATEIQNVTGYADDLVQGAGNMLLTFTNINERIFPETLSLTADLARAWGTDLNSAAVMIGKALNDPVAGLGSLSRVGIQFTDAQKELIESLVLSNDLFGAQSVLLAELQTQVGGSAEAYGQTLAGQFDILTQSVANLAETLGVGLMGVLGGPLTGAFNTVANAIKPIQAAFEQFFANVEAGMSPVQAFRFAFEDLIPPGFQGLFNAVLDVFRNLEIVLRDPAIQDSLRQIGSAFGRLFNAEMTMLMRGALTAFQGLANFIIDVGPEVATILETIAGGIKLGGQALNLLGIGGGGGANLSARGYALGGTIPFGGMGIVGEAGPELAIAGAGGTQIVPMTTNNSSQFNNYGPIYQTVPNSGTLRGMLEQAADTMS